MIKGCQREMIVLQTQDSEIFESAYFILRLQKPTQGSADMLAEANRIIRAAGEVPATRRARHWMLPILFLLGVACGALLFALIVRLITL